MEGEFADVYAGLLARGIPPEQADSMELWQVAAAFGIHRPCTNCGEPNGYGDKRLCHDCQTGDKPARDPYAGRDLIAERVAQAARTAEGAGGYAVAVTPSRPSRG